MTGYYKIVPSRNKYISLREDLNSIYNVIEVNGEWLAISMLYDDAALRGNIILADYGAQVYGYIDNPIDIRDLERAIEKKKRRRTEWQEAT